jgi:cyanophycin synthetase
LKAHDEGSVSIAHVLEFAALGLQAQAGCPVTFSRTIETIEKDTYQVVVEYTEEAVGRLAFELAQELCRAAVEDKLFNLATALAACVNLMKTSVSDPAPAPSLMQQSRAAFHIAA